MSDQPYLNLLSIGNGGKGIPYGEDLRPRSDGDQNHGFKNLKSSEYSVEDIPELANDLELRNLIEVINDKHINLF